MMKTNFLKEKLASGKAVLGTWSVIPSPVVSEIIAGAGIDFIIIDSEHGPITFETAQNMVMACESRNVSPVMRVGGANESDILKAMDIGIHCLHVPNIASVEDARKVIRYAKYPPAGNRGFSPFTRAGNYSHESAKDLTKTANENVLLAIHIEGKEAIENIDNILDLKEIDILFLGLFDISKSLGIPGEVTNRRVTKILEEMTGKIAAAGKYPGTIVNSKEQLDSYMSLGIRYFTYSVDCDVIKQSYKKIRQEFDEVQHNKGVM